MADGRTSPPKSDAKGLLYPREMLAQSMDERGLVLDPRARETLFALVDAVFFASMMLEEGHPVRIAIVHVVGGAAELATVADSRSSGPRKGEADLAWDVSQIVSLPFEPRALAKLSPGLKYGTHLVVVGGQAPDLRIDGIARRTPRTNGGAVTRFAAPRAGVVVFEREDRELFRFVAGRSFRASVDVFADTCPVRAAVGAITGDVGSQASGYSGAEWALVRLIHKMRVTGCGGILAMLPSSPPESVLSSVGYRRVDPMLLANRIRAERESTLAWKTKWKALADSSITVEQAREAAAKRVERDGARDLLESAIDDIAQLSAIDLAVLLGPGLAVFGAGYHIPGSHVEPLKALDAQGSETLPMPYGYGARHHAAFSFANDNEGGVAFVVSEDGPVSCAMKVDGEVLVWRVHVPET